MDYESIQRNLNDHYLHHLIIKLKPATLRNLLLSLILFLGVQLTIGEEHYFPLLMPDVQPLRNESYLCTAFKLPHRSHLYIVEFLPNATKHTAHHILIYGCQTPGYAYERDSPRSVWDCGEMTSHNRYDTSSTPCSGESQIVYAWAMDAPKLILPEGVGFKVGGKTKVNFLVLQVHYANADPFINGKTDRSGIILKMIDESSNRVKKRAGVLLMVTSGRLLPESFEHMEVACPIEEDMEIHPFAFRTHTHKLGKLVSGWLVKNHTWTLIGKHNPQEPQMFYPVENKSLVIRKNDVVAARCTMDNYLTEVVSIGSTGNDEMCNFYMMYYVNGDRILDKKYCFSLGPPNYYWKFDENLNFTVPLTVDKQASKP